MHNINYNRIAIIIHCDIKYQHTVTAWYMLQGDKYENSAC